MNGCKLRTGCNMIMLYSWLCVLRIQGILEERPKALFLNLAAWRCMDFSCQYSPTSFKWPSLRNFARRLLNFGNYWRSEVTCKHSHHVLCNDWMVRSWGEGWEGKKEPLSYCSKYQYYSNSKVCMRHSSIKGDLENGRSCSYWWIEWIISSPPRSSKIWDWHKLLKKIKTIINYNPFSLHQNREQWHTGILKLQAMKSKAFGTKVELA